MSKSDWLTSTPSFWEFLECAALELGLSDHSRSTWILQTKGMLNDIGLLTVLDFFINIYDVNNLLFHQDHDLFNKKTSRALLTGAFTIYCPGHRLPSLMEMLRKAAVEIKRHEEKREPWCQEAYSRLRDIGIFQVRDLVIQALEINYNLRKLHKLEFTETELMKMLNATFDLLYTIYWDKHGTGTIDV
jgi:hypothetical protein